MFFIAVVFSQEKNDGSEVHGVKSGNVFGIDVSPVNPALTTIPPPANKSALILVSLTIIVGYSRTYTDGCIGAAHFMLPDFPPTHAGS